MEWGRTSAPPTHRHIETGYFVRVLGVATSSPLSSVQAPLPICAPMLTDVCEKPWIGRPARLLDARDWEVCVLAMEGLAAGLVNASTTDGYAARGVASRPFSAAVHLQTLLIFRPDLPKSRKEGELVACLLEARSARAGEPMALKPTRRVLTLRIARCSDGLSERSSLVSDNARSCSLAALP